MFGLDVHGDTRHGHRDDAEVVRKPNHWRNVWNRVDWGDEVAQGAINGGLDVLGSLRIFGTIFQGQCGDENRLSCLSEEFLTLLPEVFIAVGRLVVRWVEFDIVTYGLSVLGKQYSASR